MRTILWGRNQYSGERKGASPGKDVTARSTQMLALRAFVQLMGVLDCSMVHVHVARLPADAPFPSHAKAESDRTQRRCFDEEY
jgi:hypothetical protein